MYVAYEGKIKGLRQLFLLSEMGHLGQERLCNLEITNLLQIQEDPVKMFHTLSGIRSGLKV